MVVKRFCGGWEKFLESRQRLRPVFLRGSAATKAISCAVVDAGTLVKALQRLGGSLALKGLERAVSIITPDGAGLAVDDPPLTPV